ncbi:MAG: recombination mediator RecR [Erysipelotrichaceae bacterium]|nr:recombination mediator RecR [Erysipelotrichaceae bacterium]
MYPKDFDKLIELFEKLPGVGNKTAQRYAFKVLESSKEDLDEYINTIKSVSNIKKCKTCGFLTEAQECVFCKDPSRDNSTIMVVESSQDAVAIEKTNMYHGLYHILGGLISSSKGVFPEDLEIDKLVNRVSGATKEVVLALSPTMDGEMTSLYIDKLLKEKNIKVTRLANGLPMGSSLDYADELTLIKAMSNRTEIK